MITRSENESAVTSTASEAHPALLRRCCTPVASAMVGVPRRSVRRRAAYAGESAPGREDWARLRRPTTSFGERWGIEVVAEERRTRGAERPRSRRRAGIAVDAVPASIPLRSREAAAFPSSSPAAEGLVDEQGGHEQQTEDASTLGHSSTLAVAVSVS